MTSSYTSIYIKSAVIYTKPPESVLNRYNPLYVTRFSQLVPWKHESVGRLLSGHQLGKPSDVRQIISTHEVVLYLLYTQTEISFNYCIKA